MDKAGYKRARFPTQDISIPQKYSDVKHYLLCMRGRFTPQFGSFVHDLLNFFRAHGINTRYGFNGFACAVDVANDRVALREVCF